MGKCFYCVGKSIPDYKQAETLKKFVSDRAKIMSRGRTGICAKHQKLLAQAIKRARHLALLSFVSQI